jgi:hypothetical protein
VAELTNLESKLGEVMGLAIAAQAATDQVTKLAQDEACELVPALQRMSDEATETETRCMQIIDGLEGKKTAIQDEAHATKSKGAQMLKTYLEDSSDALDGFAFLTMAEAGEVGHWKLLKTMNDREGDQTIAKLCEWAIPIQERHFADVNQASLQLAASEGPAARSVANPLRKDGVRTDTNDPPGSAATKPIAPKEPAGLRIGGVVITSHAGPPRQPTPGSRT